MYANLNLKRYLLALVFSAGLLPVHAQDVTYVRKVVKTLASPAFKGRGYVANGDKIASAFIADEFKKSGLIPLNKGSYFQDYDLAANTFPGKVEVKLNGELLSTAVDYLVSATSPTVQGTYPVVYADRSMIRTAEQVLALIEKAKSSFILLDNRSLAEESAAEKQQINTFVNALKNDPDLDFKGLLLYTTDKLTWTSLTYQSPRTVITINKKDLDPKTVKSISANIEAKFVPQYTTRNVAGMIKGRSNSDSTIVISAHFDHLGMLGDKVYFPGANDNASGVAMMLSFVKYFSKHKPQYNTVFIGFSGEEIGLLGSKAFVANPLIKLDEIKFLLNFDLAGTGDEGIKVVNGTIFKDKFDTIQQLNEQYKLVPKVEIRGEACNSDHCMFYQKGVPSLFIYTQGGISAYHDIYDKAETLPFTAFEGYFKLMTKFIETL